MEAKEEMEIKNSFGLRVSGLGLILSLVGNALIIHHRKIFFDAPGYFQLVTRNPKLETLLLKRNGWLK